MTEVETAAEYLRAAAGELRGRHRACAAPLCVYDRAVADWLDDEAEGAIDSAAPADVAAGWGHEMAVAAAVLGREWVPS